MTIESPTPPACAALLLAIPFALCLGADLARRATRDRDTRRVVAPGAAFAVWLLAVYAVARAGRAFLPGLVGGTLLCTLLGAPHAFRLVRDAARGRSWLPRSRRHAPVLIFVALCILAIFPTLLRHFHDELIPGGHLSIVAQLENGAFPPRFAIFPSFELNYHYGFDVAAAALAILLRLSPAAAIDATTVLALVYTAVLGCHLGRQLGGARYGLLAGLFVLFGGGMHLGCADPDAPLGHRMLGFCSVDGLWLNPPLGSYFFQHPFAAGIPLFLAVIALVSDRRSGPSAGRYVLFGVLFAALAHCQIVLFACGAASFVVAESLLPGHLAVRRAGRALLAVALALAVAASLGGFFAPASFRAGPSLASHLGVTGTLGGTLVWHARSYGMLLPAGLAGLSFTRRARLFLGLVIVGCLLVPNVVYYVHSWDIVKFTTVGQLALAVSAGCLFPRLLARGTEPPAVRHAVVGVATLLALSLIVWSASFHAAQWLGTPARTGYTSFDGDLTPLTGSDATVADRLRRLVPPGDSVYRRRGPSTAYGQSAGLSIVWLDEMPAFGFDPSLLQSRSDLLQEMPPDAAAWSRETVRWFVLDAWDEALNEHADRWIRDGQAELVLEHGELRVVHLRIP
jgi:hypothetical protein